MCVNQSLSLLLSIILQQLLFALQELSVLNDFINDTLTCLNICLYNEVIYYVINSLR